MRTVLLVVAAVACCAGTWAQSGEMVTNGSFETVGDDGLPEGWQVRPEGAASVVTGDAPDGSRWLRMVKPEGSSHILAFQRHSVKPNSGYRVRAYLRAPKPSFYLLVAYDASMSTLASKPTGWAALEDWVELELDFRTRESDTVVSIGLLGYGLEAEWDAVRMWEDDTVRIGDLTPAVNEPAEPTAVERERGFMVFGRKANDLVGPRCAPTRWDCQTPIRGACPPGEFETIVVGIHALRDLPDVRAELRLPDRSALAAELLQVAPSRRALNSRAWERYPLLLVPAYQTALAAGETLQYAVRVRVPEAARASHEALALWLRSGDSFTPISVLVDLPPVRLDPADATFFMYFNDFYLPPEMATAPMQAAYYRDMAAHGMNSVSLYTVPELTTDAGSSIALHRDLRYAAGDPRHSLGIAERIAQMRAAGLATAARPLVLISGGSGHYDWGAFRDPASVRELMRLGGALGWPPLLFYMHDEPNLPERIEGVRRTHERVYAGTPEARTVTAIGEYGIEQVGGLYDVWIASLSAVDDDLIERARREGRELWAYDCRQRGQRPEFDRFVCGVWAWATGVRGIGQWAYYSEEALQRASDGGWEVPGEFDGWYMMPSEAGPIATAGWEARREGIEDYRALRTLERLVAERGPEADVARRLLERARAFAPVDAFADARADWRYVWEYCPWRQQDTQVSAWREMSEMRAAAYEQIALLQAAGR